MARPVHKGESLYVWDLSCWVFRHFAKTQDAMRAAQAFLDQIERVHDEQHATFAVVCADAPVRTFRHELFPAYKGQRPKKDPALVKAIQYAGELAQDVLGLRVLSGGGFEADDFVATVARQGAMRGVDVVLMALDKDLMQLLGERVCMWDGKRELHVAANVPEQFGVAVDQLRDYLALVGDAADNIPGAVGIGPHAAVRILTACGSLAEALRLAAEGGWPKSLPKGYALKLRTQEAQVRMCYELVGLAEVNLALDLSELRVKAACGEYA